MERSQSILAKCVKQEAVRPQQLCIKHLSDFENDLLYVIQSSNHASQQCALVADPDLGLPERLKAVESAIVSLAMSRSLESRSPVHIKCLHDCAELCGIHRPCHKCKGRSCHFSRLIDMVYSC